MLFQCRHHVRTCFANGTAKTMSGRTSTTMTFSFGRIGKVARFRLIHRKTQSSNIHLGRAFIRGRSVASRWLFFDCFRWGFRNATYVLVVGSTARNSHLSMHFSMCATRRRARVARRYDTKDARPRRPMHSGQWWWLMPWTCGYIEMRRAFIHANAIRYSERKRTQRVNGFGLFCL